MCERHTHGVLGLEDLKQEYHFMIGDSEIGRQFGMEVGQRIWAVSLSAKQSFVIVNF